MKEKGLYGKYIVTKTDGEPTEPQAQYFVLRIDTDPHAQKALVAYARSIKKDNPTLAEDLIKWLRDVTGDAKYTL